MEIENSTNRGFSRRPLENWIGQDEDRLFHVDQAEFPPPHVHPDNPPEEPHDAGAAREKLLPVDVPPPATRVEGTSDNSSDNNAEKLRVLDDFGGRIMSLDEEDFGDWMRRANVYWHRLMQAFADEDRQTHQHLAEIHRLIQYNPSFRLQDTRRRVIDLVLAMRERFNDRLGRHETLDPHDYAVSTAGSQGEQGPPAYSVRLSHPVPARVGPAVADGSNRGFIGKG
ncbi:MAG: hypothetical protein NDI61_09995 [Bdellovibrionaceae bacterium]|nr:hypothetical protein [Pseudobdellovibrionaceae bacterium]